MKCSYKVVSAAIVLFLAFASPAVAAPGPLETILSAPFEITVALANFAVNFPASLADHPHRARRGVKARVQHAAHRHKRRQPAYRFREPVEEM